MVISYDEGFRDRKGWVYGGKVALLSGRRDEIPSEA